MAKPDTGRDIFMAVDVTSGVAVTVSLRKVRSLLIRFTRTGRWLVWTSKEVRLLSEKEARLV